MATSQSSSTCASASPESNGRNFDCLCLSIRLYLRVMVWTPNRIIAFFLVLGITLAPALFAAPATGLTLQMSMTHDVGSNECDCCSDAKPNRDLCVWMCVLPPATLQSNHLVSIAFHDDYALRRELTLSSRAISPDPPPPRSIAFR